MGAESQSNTSPAVREREGGSEREWHQGTCSQCQRSFETVLQIAGVGPLCPGCFNVLEEDDHPAVVEVIEDE